MFGAPFPEAIGDEFFPTPLTSYGTQKAIGELLLADYTRRGFLDGIGIRLPTICVRPGQAEQGGVGLLLRASSASRWPGRRRCCRSPRRAPLARQPARGGRLPHPRRDDRPAQLGPRRNLSMPGVSATVGEQIEALRRIAGDKVAARIRREPDPTITSIVAGWPRDFDARRAPSLGFKAETSFDDIVRVHIEDELGGQVGGLSRIRGGDRSGRIYRRR